MKLTTYEDVEWRMNRLKVVRSFAEYMGYDKLINCLHDHKGCLEVYWITNPEEQESSAMHSMWRLLNEESISHYIGRGPGGRHSK